MKNVFTYNDFVHRVEINEKGTIQLKIEVVPLGDPGGIIRFAHDPVIFLSNKPNDARSKAAYHFLFSFWRASLSTFSPS